VRAVAPAPVARVELIYGSPGGGAGAAARPGAVVSSAPGEGRRELFWSPVAPALRAGDYLYVRVVQEDDGAAWSSPFFVFE
jgi:hypothetical protein